MHAETNDVIISSNMNEKMEVASLTKIMTAYTVLCICHLNNIKIREHSITIHQEASYMEGTSAGLRCGEELLVIDLLYGLLLPLYKSKNCRPFFTSSRIGHSSAADNTRLLHIQWISEHSGFSISEYFLWYIQWLVSVVSAASVCSSRPFSSFFRLSFLSSAKCDRSDHFSSERGNAIKCDQHHTLQFEHHDLD